MAGYATGRESEGAITEYRVSVFLVLLLVTRSPYYTPTNHNMICFAREVISVLLASCGICCFKWGPPLITRECETVH